MTHALYAHRNNKGKMKKKKKKRRAGKSTTPGSSLQAFDPMSTELGKKNPVNLDESADLFMWTRFLLPESD
jgi:hypothetical protein